MVGRAGAQREQASHDDAHAPAYREARARASVRRLRGARPSWHQQQRQRKVTRGAIHRPLHFSLGRRIRPGTPRQVAVGIHRVCIRHRTREVAQARRRPQRRRHPCPRFLRRERERQAAEHSERVPTVPGARGCAPPEDALSSCGHARGGTCGFRHGALIRWGAAAPHDSRELRRSRHNRNRHPPHRSTVAPPADVLLAARGVGAGIRRGGVRVCGGIHCWDHWKHWLPT